MDTSTRVLDSFSHTGNFVVQSDRDRIKVAEELALVFNTKFAVLQSTEVAEYVSVLEKLPMPEPEPGFRWTPGLVFGVEVAHTDKVTMVATSRARFHPIPPRVVGAWKRDKLTNSKVLDRNSRGGGWGAVSKDVALQSGGVWTGRSLRPVKGLLGLVEKVSSSL